MVNAVMWCATPAVSAVNELMWQLWLCDVLNVMRVAVECAEVANCGPAVC